MKRCTLFLSTAGGLSPYGTFTNITTDQTSGVCRQIWHTYLNEQQGSLGSLGLCRETSAERLRLSSITQQRYTLHLSFISFLPGQEAHLPKVNKNENKVFFFSPPRNNVPDKWGFCPLGLSVLKSRGNVCKGFKQPEINGGKWERRGQDPINTLKSHTVNKVKLDMF